LHFSIVFSSLLWDDDILNNKNGKQNEKGTNEVGFHHSVALFRILKTNTIILYILL